MSRYPIIQIADKCYASNLDYSRDLNFPRYPKQLNQYQKKCIIKIKKLNQNRSITFVAIYITLEKL